MSLLTSYFSVDMVLSNIQISIIFCVLQFLYNSSSSSSGSPASRKNVRFISRKLLGHAAKVLGPLTYLMQYGLARLLRP